MFMIWQVNGGGKTMQDFGSQPIPVPYLKFMERMPLWHKTDDYIFVHAGLKVGGTPASSSAEDLLWQREPFLSSPYDWGKRVICGHNIQTQGPLVMSNKICIDTGSFLPAGTLTCLILPTLEFACAH